MARAWLVLIPAAAIGWMAAQVVVGALGSTADRPLRPSAALAARFSREVAARLIFCGLGWLVFGPQRPRGHSRGHPVVLVGGLTHNRASLWLLRTALVQRGYLVDLVERRGTLAEDAAILAARIRALRVESGSAVADVVGFSSGGLVAARAARAPDHGIGRIVTIATPWGGTRTARFRLGRAPAELRRGAPGLAELWPVPVDVVCLVAPDDPIIPVESATPPGARVVSIPDGGHYELLASARTFRAVLAALGPPEAP